MNCYLQSSQLHIAFDGDLCEAAFLVVAVIKNQGPLENQWETEIRVVVCNVIASSEQVGGVQQVPTFH